MMQPFSTERFELEKNLLDRNGFGKLFNLPYYSKILIFWEFPIFLKKSRLICVRAGGNSLSIRIFSFEYNCAKR